MAIMRINLSSGAWSHAGAPDSHNPPENLAEARVAFGDLGEGGSAVQNLFASQQKQPSNYGERLGTDSTINGMTPLPCPEFDESEF